MSLSEKVAYIKGLAEGLALDTTTKEGKLITAIIDVLEDVAYDIADIEENALDLAEEIDAISDDLADVEDVVFEDDDDDYDYDDDDEDDEDDDEDEEMFSVVCPACDEELVVDADILELGEIECPNCGEKLEFEFDEDEEDEE